MIEQTELLVPSPAHACAGLLGIELPDLDAVGLPILWHWFYLLDRSPQADIGVDGHRIRGGIPSPPAVGKRRMIAGGRVRQSGSLRLGVVTTRRTTILSETERTGRSGRLLFVTVKHEISQAGSIVISEEVDVVYRDAVTGPPAREEIQERPIVAVIDGEWEINVDPVLLFRFSALTYNSHRIHYDRDYAINVEGYSGLVVHGPLQALAMAELARRSIGNASTFSFEYRLTSPLFDHQGMVASASPEEATRAIVTSVRDQTGRITAVGRFMASNA